MLEEASQAAGREGACGGRAGLGDLSTAVSEKGFRLPRASGQGKGPPWQSEQKAGGFRESGTAARPVSNVLVRRASLY